MKKNTRYWCIVPAAGVGRRMGGDIPKQYLPLGNSTVIQQTLAKLIQVKQFESIVVCLSTNDQWWRTLDYPLQIPDDQQPKVEKAPGGKERSDSVLNGLKYLADRANDDDWVLVHDVARPCIRVSDIRKLMNEVSGYEVGGLLAAPVRDTMKRAVKREQNGPDGVSHDVRVDNSNGNQVAVVEVQETVCRENLWHALTPQMFRYGDLMQAMSEALAKGYPVTDEASAIELQGKHPMLVEGHSDNIKVTRPEDLALAELFLTQAETLDLKEGNS